MLSGRQDRPVRSRRIGAVIVPSALCIAVGWLLFLVLTTPVGNMLDIYVPDDAFYYFQTARIFSQTGFSSFDGINFTNGYQPLWFLVCAGIFALFPQGGLAPFYVLMSFQSVLFIMGCLLLYRFLSRLFGYASASVAMVAYIHCALRLSVNGLESGLLGFLFIAYLVCYFKYIVCLRQAARDRLSHALLGSLAGLLFLARTDMVFLILISSLAIIGTRPDKKHLQKAAFYFIPLGLLAGTYLAINLYTTGHLMPVSGAAKMYYSARARGVAAGDDGLGLAVLNNLLWPIISRPGYFVAVALLGSIMLPVMAKRCHGSCRLRMVARLWPFYLATWLCYLFYGVCFFGEYTRTHWYYLPHAIIAAFSTAALPVAFPQFRHKPEISGLAAMLPVGFMVNWGYPGWASASASLFALVSVIMIRCMPRRGVRAIGFSMQIVLLMALLIKAEGMIQREVFALVLLLLTGLATFGRRDAHRAGSALVVATLILLSIIPFSIRMQEWAARTPATWGFNLYTGALWARDNLPEDATIWSGSTGILGYFSERRCVNTDGLINSYDFLESVLKAGHLVEYCRQWDYAIDAYASSNLETIYPGGRFLDLPETYRQIAFKDGDRIRNLGVFKMPGADSVVHVLPSGGHMPNDVSSAVGP